MFTVNSQKVIKTTENAKTELYKLIGEGYRAMQDGKTSTIEEVKEKLNQRRTIRG